MKINRLIVLLIAFLFLSAPLFAQGRRGERAGKRNQGNCQSQNLNLQDASLTEVEISSLKFMHEEEKLAHDLYDSFYRLWGLNVFSNITRSESTHQQGVSRVLRNYGIDDSVVDENAAGVFINQELQALYNQLYSRGSSSVIEALKVGALVEEVDIRDLQNGLSVTNNPSINRLYENLRSASENHLRAFTRNLSLQGETYLAQVLSSEEVASIQSSSFVKGKRKSGKNSNRNGSQGRGAKGGGQKICRS